MMIRNVIESSDKLSIIYNHQKLIGFGCMLLTGIIFYLYIIFAHQRPHTFISPRIEIWHTFEEKIKRPPHLNRDHGFCGYCPYDKQISRAWQLIDIVTSLSPKNPFLVNIGAASSSGGKFDPTYPLLISTELSFSALLIDPNSSPSLFYAYPNRSDIRIAYDYIWPETVIEKIFQKYNVPKQFTLLKVDIDSYECSLIEKILSANYRPQIIHTEFNPVFPPPIVFMTVYNETTKHDWKPSVWANIGAFYGCSLTALSNLLEIHDYVLVEVDFWDAIYIERDLVRIKHIQVPANDKVAYEHGFLNHSCFSYCQYNQKLYNANLLNIMKSVMNQSDFSGEIRKVFDFYAPVSIKTQQRHPYIITL